MRYRSHSFPLKKLLSATVSVTLIAGALLTSGCSTPKVALRVGNDTAGYTEYSTADYLAYLYNTYYTLFNYNGYAYYESYGMGSPWDQKLTYGEGDDAKEVPLEEYITLSTKDTMIRQRALEDLMKKYDISISEEDEKTLQTNLSSLSNDTILPMGFNKDTYAKMYQAVSLNESTLFYGLYDEGGSRAMSEADQKEYYGKNFLTYKAIDVTLTDENNSDLDDAGIAEVKAKLQKYLDMYNNGKDFDDVISQYTSDKQAESSTDTDGASSDTDSSDVSSDASSETSSEASSDDGTVSDASSEASGSATETDEEELEGDESSTDSNLKLIDANTETDTDLTEAVKSVEVGKAAIVQYKASGTTNTMSLILRLDPEQTEHNFENSRKNIIYGAKYKEFNAEVDEYIKTLKAEWNNTVLKKCTPKKLEEDSSQAAS